MPKIRLAQPFDNFHGTVSGQTVNNRMILSSSRREANTGRSWKAPNNPRSFRQIEVRKYMTLASAAYRDLDKAVADDWVDAANSHARTNILGLEYYLTGIALFLMINLYRQIDAKTITNAVPDIITPPVPLEVSSVKINSSTSLTIEADVTGLETEGLGYVRFSPPLPGQARRARSRDCRLLDPVLSKNIYHHSAGFLQITLNMPANYFVVGSRLGVELRSLSEFYWPGPALLVPNMQATAP